MKRERGKKEGRHKKNRENYKIRWQEGDDKIERMSKKERIQEKDKGSEEEGKSVRKGEQENEIGREKRRETER